jgi:hypothetical protein
MKTAGFYTGWDAPQTNQFPFVIEGEVLASLSTDPDHGSGWVMPAPHPLVEPAEYNGKPLGFYFSKELAAAVYITSLQIVQAPPFSPLGPERTQALPGDIPVAGADVPQYLTSLDPDAGRSVPQFLNIRYQLNSDGSEVNLNDSPTLVDTVTEGGYWARHFFDYGCDGWVAARCAELDAEVPLRVPAFSLVCPPTFYPYANQRALTEWTENEAPEELRGGIWAIPPRPLSDRRQAANIELPAGFSIDDDTVTAIVSLPTDAATQQSGQPATHIQRHVQLPDGAAGLFDPGWEVSQDRTADNQFFFADHGLGTPFIEDAKFCAALSAYWPGAAPDNARKFPPYRQIAGTSKAWPTIAPLTDEELGSAEVPGQGFMPWDGIPGPRLTVVDGEEVVDYPDFYHVDYLETVEHFTAALTGVVDLGEYTSRVLAMAQVYWSLGIRYSNFSADYELAEALDRFQAAKGEWTVLSFRAIGDETDDDLAEAQAEMGVELQGDTRYRFHLYQWNGTETKPEDVRRTLVGIKDQAIAYTDLVNVLLRRNDAWEHHLPPH